MSIFSQNHFENDTRLLTTRASRIIYHKIESHPRVEVPLPERITIVPCGYLLVGHPKLRQSPLPHLSDYEFHWFLELLTVNKESVYQKRKIYTRHLNQNYQFELEVLVYHMISAY